MTRAIYRSLLHLHPRDFRRQFAGEMLWIFDEAASSEGAWVLFLDLVISVMRQWLARSGAWKVAVALIGALLQIMGGGLGFVIRPLMVPHRISENTAGPPASVNDLLVVTFVALGVVFGLLFSLVIWVNGLNRKRLTIGKAQKWRIKA